MSKFNKQKFKLNIEMILPSWTADFLYLIYSSFLAHLYRSGRNWYKSLLALHRNSYQRNESKTIQKGLQMFPGLEGGKK